MESENTQDPMQGVSEPVRQLVNLLGAMICGIVDQPDMVTIDIDSGAEWATLTFATADDDSGRIIGTGGNTIKSIRHLLQTSARRAGIKLTIDYANDERAVRRRRRG